MTPTPTIDTVAVPRGVARGKNILFLCAGLNEHRKRCGKLLFVFNPPPSCEQSFGTVEVKCRRCHTVNFIALADSLAA